MIDLDEARAFVLGACGPLPTVRVALPEALGCVAVEGLVATESVPPFANTAVDGFAVRAADTIGATATSPVRFRVIGTIRAGMAPAFPPGPGEAVRIMTGAPLPDSADAVVMVEDSAPVGDHEGAVDLAAEVAPGAHVRPAGDDLQPGDPVFPPGDLITAGHLGVLATFGVTEVEVVPRARVGVFSTGDELVEGPQALQPGQIRDSNRRTLLGLVEQAGCIGVDLGRIPDDEAAIAAAIERGAATCDALVSSGGVSMGDFDYVMVVLDRIGDLRWMQVAIKPAKPLAFGTVPGPTGTAAGGPNDAPGRAARRIPVFGLPGNPVSSVVSFELFARPGLRSMMGRAAADLDRPRVRAVTDEPMRRHRDGKVHFARVVCRTGEDGRFHVRSAGGQGSHHLSALVGANALAVLPDGDAVDAGAEIDVLLTELGA
ncbi:MAG: molybdopterin molybdotransferase MoeA [Acidimicrobiales bacterium]